MILRSEFRNRAFLPVVLPLGIVLVVGVAVAGFALLLLYNTREVALVLAAVTAAGILFAAALAASKDRLTGRSRLVVVAAAATPLVLAAIVAVGVVPVDESALNINRRPEEDPAIVAGRRLAEAQACLGCHSTDGSTLVGPTWQDLWGSEVTLNSGESVTVDRDYIAESVRQPNAFAREGFQTGVMPTTFDLSDQQIDQLVAFMQSISTEGGSGEATEDGA